MTYADISSFLSGNFDSSLLPVIFHYTILLSPIMMAAALGTLMWKNWVRYVQLKQFNGLKYTVLDLKLPKDTFKSPLAMETVLGAIHNTSDGSHYAQWWRGETRPWYSLEIISVEGEVKFLIWTEDRRKNNLMSALYSQYPGIEITELEDYSKSVQFDPKELKIWGSEFQFTSKAKDKGALGDVYPIKTYVDYGLDKDPKEEFKIDPLTHQIEWLGSLRPNEQAWFQYIVRAHKKDQKASGFLWKRTDKYKESVDKEIHTLMMRDPKTKATVSKDDEDFASIPRFTKGEQEVVSAIERKASKMVFDVCIRAMYIAKRSAFDTPFGIGGCISSMKQFSTEHLNGFKPGGKMMPGSFDHDWDDYKSMRRNYYSKRLLMAYRRRSAFYPPFKVKTMVMNTEELATIYHFPGSVSATPNLARVPSKKGTAPGNLPI